MPSRTRESRLTCGTGHSQGPEASPHPHIPTAAHLLGGQDGHVVLVDEPRLLVHRVLVGLGLELLAGQPEEHVLLTVLCAQELPEGPAARGAAHQLVEGLRPALHLLGARRAAAGTRRQVRPGQAPAIGPDPHPRGRRAAGGGSWGAGPNSPRLAAGEGLQLAVLGGPPCPPSLFIPDGTQSGGTALLLTHTQARVWTRGPGLLALCKPTAGAARGPASSTLLSDVGPQTTAVFLPLGLSLAPGACPAPARLAPPPSPTGPTDRVGKPQPTSLAPDSP